MDRGLKKNLFWVLLVSVLGGAAGVGYSIYKGTTYTAELTFATAESEGGSLSKLSALGSQFGFDLGGGSSSAFGGENLLELMKSRRLVETTLFDSITLKNRKKVRLLERYLERNKVEESENPPVSFVGVGHRDSCAFRQDSTLKEIYEIIIEEKLTTSVVDEDLAFKKVALNDEDEEFAKGFCGAFNRECNGVLFGDKNPAKQGKYCGAGAKSRLGKTRAHPAHGKRCGITRPISILGKRTKLGRVGPPKSRSTTTHHHVRRGD